MPTRKNGFGEGPSSVRQDHAPIRMVLLWQLVASGIAAAVAGIYYPPAMKSVVYGCLVSITPGTYLWWRLRKPQTDAANGVVRQAYQIALTRMLMVIVLLSLPLWHKQGYLFGGVLIGFVCGQSVWLMGWAWTHSGKQK